VTSTNVASQEPQATLDELAVRIRAEHQAAAEAARNGILHALQAGQLLREAQKQVPHGEWSHWLERNCEFNERTARRYVQLASLWDVKSVAATDLHDLPITTVIKRLAPPLKRDNRHKTRPACDLGDRSPEEFAAATALTEILEDFVRKSASVDIPLALRGCEKAQLEGLLASARSASERLTYLLLGGGDAPDGLVGCVAEVSKTSDGKAEPTPTLDPRAWSIATAEQRQAFVKAVGRSEIEIVFHAIDPSYASTRDSNAFFAVNVRRF
jgi:Protein of unknown function (DUF3102)